MASSRPVDMGALLFRDEADRFFARFAGCTLESLFQPLCYRSGGVFGHEAFLQVRDGSGRSVPAPDFFDGLPDADRIVAGRLAMLIHIRNYVQGGAPGMLNLNLLPEALVADAGHFAGLQRQLGLMGLEEGCVIFEVSEFEVASHPRVAESLRMAAGAGFGLAIDAFGAVGIGHQVLQTLSPDIIKIDRSLLLDHGAGNATQLPAVLAYGWSLGARMLVDGIDDAERLAAMQALGVELYQGAYLGRPLPLAVTRIL